MVSPHSLVPREGSSHLQLFREPSWKTKQFPLLCPGFHQNPAFTLSVSEPSVCLAAQCSCVLSQGYGWVSKLQILGTQHSSDTHWSSELGSCCAVAGAICPRKVVAWPCRGSEFMVKHSQNLASRLAAFSRCLCCCLTVPAIIFVLRGSAIFPKCTPTRGTASFGVTQEILGCRLLLGLCPPSPQ